MTTTKVPEEVIEQAFRQINKLADAGKLVLALKHCEELFCEFPEHPRVMQGIGLLRYRTGAREEGESLLQQLIKLRPDYADAYHNYGNMLLSRELIDEAEGMYRRALEIAPEHYKALASLALALTMSERWQEALQCCEMSLKINPRHALGYEVMGKIMPNIGRAEESIYFFRKALQFKKTAEAHSSMLFAMNLQLDIEQVSIYEESVRWGKRYTLPVTRKARQPLNSPIPNRRIRVGYVSGDFKQHPVAFHLKPVLAAHDTEQFEVYLYSSFPKIDDVTKELIGCVDYFRDISSISDEKAEELIRLDGIDILVDLAGHTGYNRLTLFARKPAPVQVTWLGYFNTTGVEAIDYLLSDAITIPPGEEDWFTEHVVRLPDCRFCYAPPGYAPDVVSPPVLRNGYVTFGSFNKIAKINSQVITVWARVLHAVPYSRLLLKWWSLKDNDVKEAILHLFALHGIGAERLILRSASPHPAMLAEYGDVDIALDTFPYNGGATTCEALWMGVPVITMDGRTPIGRQSKAFLHTIGKPEWVAKTPDAYVEIAQSLADDALKLQEIRNSLRKQTYDSPLCSGKSFTRHLEAAYHQMWHEWCSEVRHCNILSSVVRRISTDELYNAGVISMSDGDYQRSSQLFHHVLRRNPRHKQAINNLGISLYMTGRISESVQAFRRAIRHDKGFVEAYSNLGRVLLDIGEARKSLKMCRQAVAIKPNHIDALINLGNACKEIGQMEEARRAFERVLEIDPNHELALRLLSVVLQGYGDIPAALKLLRHALDIVPTSLEAVSSLLMTMQYNNSTSQQDILTMSRRFGGILEHRQAANRVVSCLDQKREHLNIGFVSADFRYHPVGMLLSALFREYNQSRLSLFCYYNGHKRDEVTDWYRSASTGWREIRNFPDEDTAALIRNDGIDILVDLSGHTDGYRLSLFALKPAPVQASWMGYGHTTGLSSMDYIIADEYFISPEDEQWFTEKVVRLPHGRFCFTPPFPCPDVTDPPFEENGYVTFGCFNNLAKISPEVIACWARILRRVPRSRLILKWKSFHDSGLRRHFRNAFVKYGISPRRLEFRTYSKHYFLMLEYGDVDIALDPFPFTGGMTSLEALWMGVPVVTQRGQLPISRQTQSFLNNIGLPELVTENDEDYIALAAELAHDPAKLRDFRALIRDRMIHSPLCNSSGFATSVEYLFYSIWQETASSLNYETV